LGCVSAGGREKEGRESIGRGGGQRRTACKCRERRKTGSQAPVRLSEESSRKK